MGLKGEERDSRANMDGELGGVGSIDRSNRSTLALLARNLVGGVGMTVDVYNGGTQGGPRVQWVDREKE